MRCIIAGGRDFDNYDLLQEKCDLIFANKKPDEIVSGCAKGADALGILYANSKNIFCKRFPALWLTYGNAAGPIRNRQMAEYATHLIAFWDGKSRGTKNMIDVAKEFNLPTRIIRY